jgi:outer membrane protein assembly factor BamB
MHHAILTTVLCGAVAGGAAWPGFRGLTHQGRAPEGTPPVTWSRTENVVWRAPVAGHANSSPIVAGDRVYVTTAYKTERHLARQKTLDGVLAAIAAVLCAMAAGVGLRILAARARGVAAAAAWGRTAAVSGLTVVIAWLALFGHGAFTNAESAFFLWAAAGGVLACSLGLGALAAPPRSVWWAALGICSLLAAVPVYLTLEARWLIFNFGSMGGIACNVILAAPLGLGCFLLAGFTLWRRFVPAHGEATPEPRPRRTVLFAFGSSAGAGTLAALAALGLLVLRGAGFNPRAIALQPILGWGAAAGFLVIVLAVISWRIARFRVRPRPAGTSGAFIVVALALSAGYFVKTHYVAGRPELVRAIVCLDRETGATLWAAEGLAGPGEGDRRPNTPATPTPVAVDGSVAAYFGPAGLLCVDTGGTERWSYRPLPFRSDYGAASSPAAAAGRIVIACDQRRSTNAGEEPPYVVAFDARTGTEAWRRDRPVPQDTRAVYSSPLVTTRSGRPLVILWGWEDVTAYDPRTGEDVWTYGVAHRGQHVVASLASDTTHLYVPGSKTVRALAFDALETGGDPLVWETRAAGEKASSPVVAEGLLYLVTESGVAYCLDGATGERLWRHRLRGQYFASVVAAGGHVYFTSDRGRTTVVAQGRSLELVAENDLEEETYATPTPAGDSLFLRTAEAVYHIRRQE